MKKETEVLLWFVAIFLFSFVSLMIGVNNGKVLKTHEYCSRDVHLLSESEEDQRLFKEFGVYLCEICNTQVSKEVIE